tara:strand:- start:719 stop:961 length:243 start_codon:yes stop_codon:yes gene_type:complete
MKIKVNKDAQRRKLIDTANTVVIMAEDCALRGLERFNFNYPKGYGFDAQQLINQVEKQTEGTVYAGYRSVSNGAIKFTIR